MSFLFYITNTHVEYLLYSLDKDQNWSKRGRFMNKHLHKTGKATYFLLQMKGNLLFLNR